jgi:hypothetical protein
MTRTRRVMNWTLRSVPKETPSETAKKKRGSRAPTERNENERKLGREQTARKPVHSVEWRQKMQKPGKKDKENLLTRGG